MLPKSISKPKSSNGSAGSWTASQHELFITGLQKIGKNWKKLSDFVPTRTQSQIRSHAQKYFDKLETKFEPIDRLGEEYEKIKGPLEGGDLREYRIYLDLVKPKRRGVGKQHEEELTNSGRAGGNILISELFEESYSLGLVGDTVQFTPPVLTESLVDLEGSFFSQMQIFKLLRMKSYNLSFGSWKEISFLSRFVETPGETKQKGNGEVGLGNWKSEERGFAVVPKYT